MDEKEKEGTVMEKGQKYGRKEIRVRRTTAEVTGKERAPCKMKEGRRKGRQDS